MEQLTKTGRMVLYIAFFVLLLSLFLSVRAVQGLRRANQSLSQQQQLWPLLEKSLQLSEQSNAELWAAFEENKAIVTEFAKPVKLRHEDLETRRTRSERRMEGIHQLLIEQQKINDQIRAIQKQNDMVNQETKALLEKY